MATMIKLKCANKDCGKEFEKPLGEVNRRIKLGSTDFYCCSKCAGVNNKKRTNPIIKKICPVCSKEFETKSGAKEATFCSRSCASKGSVNDARRNAGRYSASINFKPDTHRPEHIQLLLKQREAWKYIEIKKLLEFLEEPFEFEYLIDKYIYDLALINRHIFIEFDGPEHKYLNENDKENTALQNGWTIIRHTVQPNEVIKPDFLYSILKS